MATIISTKTSGVGGLEVTGDATGILQLASNNGTTAVTVDASQNVGIGTTSPTSFGAGTTVLQVNSPSSFVATLVSSGSYVLQTIASQTHGTMMMGSRSNHNVSFCTNDTPRATLDTSGNFQFNSGYGSVATAYGCRAWVNFNGTGTVAIRASGNVTSITDNGTGSYNINFTSAMPDVNYSISGMACESSGGSVIWQNDSSQTPQTTTVRIAVGRPSVTLADNAYVFAMIIR